MQCSGKQSRPEAPLRAPNRFLFLADDLGKIISLSFLSSICHVMETVITFHSEVSIPFILIPLIQKTTTHFALAPLHHLFSDLLCLACVPEIPASVDCITWFCYCFALNWVRPVEGTGKALEGKKGKVGWFSCTHTAPSLTRCCSGVPSGHNTFVPLLRFFFF